MDSSSLAIQIIPDLHIDDKYSAIIGETQARVNSFTENALKGRRLAELFFLERSKLDEPTAEKILTAKGPLVAGFQFEARPDASNDNFRVYVKKVAEQSKKSFKFYLTVPVQEIMLQLISLEDRRTIAIFSMLNSSLDVGYRILTTLYGNQLRRLLDQAAEFVRGDMAQKLEKLSVARSAEDEGIWGDGTQDTQKVSGLPEGNRPGSQDNILQVMADDATFNELNQYVENVKSRRDRIKEKRRQLEENPEMARHEFYRQMIREDFGQLENCYARIHIYLKAFYKNKERRTPGQNKVLRLFFAGEIEKISGETGLLEDLLALSEDAYFKNLDRHAELS